MRSNGVTYHLREQQFDLSTFGDDGLVDLTVDWPR